MHPLYKSGIRRIGFGGWQIGGESYVNGKPNGWGLTNRKESLDVLRYAMENGINFIDTAPGYGNGNSENLIGAAGKGLKKENIICTKFVNTRDLGGKIIFDYSESSMKKSVDGSLKRLNAECLDILLLHSPPDDFNWSEYDPSPFEKLIQQGKIKFYGVSSKTVAGAEKVVEAGFGSIVEAIFNVLDRRAESSLTGMCDRQNYFFISRLPLASGFLTPKTLQGKRSFPMNDIRSTYPADMKEWLEESTRKLSFLNDLEGKINVSSLRFQLSNPNVPVAIVGVKNIRHVDDILLALKLGPLDSDVIKQIRKVLPKTFWE